MAKRRNLSLWAISPFVTFFFFKSPLPQILENSFACGKRVNPFPHTTILQQTTLDIFCKKVENLYNKMDNLWLKVENIVAKGEIARFVQFLLLSLWFQIAVCCRGIRKHLYEGKGLTIKHCNYWIWIEDSLILSCFTKPGK